MIRKAQINPTWHSNQSAKLKPAQTNQTTNSHRYVSLVQEITAMQEGSSAVPQINKQRQGPKKKKKRKQKSQLAFLNRHK